MTYELIEVSIDNGKPVRLYKFNRGVMTWTYCTGDRDITLQTLKYKSMAISDNEIQQSGEAAADAFEVYGPAGLDVAQLFRGVGPSNAIEVTVYDLHYGDFDAVIAYMGSIYSVNWPAEDRCTIVCNTDSVGLASLGLKLTWGRGCGHMWGDHNCLVNKDLYRVDALVQSKDGLIISSGTFETKPDGWFAGGYVEWPVGTGQYDSRGIVSHVGSVLELLGGTDGIGLGMTLTAYPGCNRTIQECHDKYDNDENCGANPHQPGKSPFDGTPVM